MLNKKLKILYIHQYFCVPNGSGGIRSYKNALALKNCGYSVTVLCINDGRNSIGNIMKKKSIFGSVGFFEGIKIKEYNIKYSNYMSLVERSIVFIRFFIQSSFEALFGHYQIIYATSTPITVAIPGILAKLFRRRKFVFEARDSWPELPFAMGLINNIFLYKLLLLLEHLTYLSADVCIGLAPGICERFLKKGVEISRIKNIPNSCDTELFMPLNKSFIKKPQLINKYFSPSDFVLAFTGAHGLANGLESVLDVAKLLKKKNYENIKFLFIGDGKVKPKLLKIKEMQNLSNCFFMDPVSKKNLAVILRDSVHVGLMVLKDIKPFYDGTSPNKFFDYLASGLPIINNYPGWISKIIIKYNLGLVTKPNNPNDFAKAIIYIANNDKLRNEMSKNARNTAEEVFSREVQTKKITDIFRDISKSL